jgi:hypothetical protein
MSILVILLLALIGLGCAATAVAEEIQPDRPEVTESARLVPRGGFQLETGLVVSRQRFAGQPAQEILGIEADLRIGVTRHLEVDIEGDPVIHARGPEENTGFGDIAIGLRYRFVEAVGDEPWPPSVAVKPVVKIPVARKPIGTGRPDFGLLLLASCALPWEVELEVNAGAAAIGQTESSGYRAQALASAAASRDILPDLYVFVELFYRSREQRDEGQQLAINAGLVYRVTPNFAVDAGVQTSLFGQGPDYVIRTGLSLLFLR